MFKQKNLKTGKELSVKRLNELFIFIITCFIILLIHLWYLQVIRGEEYEQRAINNCIRSLVEQAPRGEIYDQQGKLLVTNRPAVNFSVITAEISDYQELSDEISSIVSLESSLLKEKFQTLQHNPFQAQDIMKDLGKEQIIAIEEQKYKFKGTLLTIQPERKYLYQNLAGHILGYVNEISEEELKDPLYEYLSGGDIVGKNGLEKYYDSYLRGEKGEREVEVDALGREVATLRSKEPIAGNDIYLTIDSQLQRYVQDLLAEQRGTIIVSEPFTGRILAMASQPGYDPNMFTQKMTLQQWQEITQNKENVLYNRNIQGVYSPGSVFKLITAIAALEEGIIDTQNQVYCPGYFKLGDQTFKCWKEAGHGNQAIVEAITNSCNVFFYTMGQKLGIDRLSQYAERFGLGEKTRIDLPGELEGLVPNQEWKRKTFNQIWYPGDTINMSIGQGYLLVTPFQIHNMACLIASQGKFLRPTLVQKIISPSGEIIKEFEPELIKDIGISSETFQIVKEGMRKVIEKGTGRLAYIEEISIAGKTGTAQNPQGENHAWFICFAPIQNPEICVTVFIEHGGDGSQAAAPLGSKIIERYYQLKHGFLAQAYKQ